MEMQGELFVSTWPRFLAAGDTALTIELGEPGAPGSTGRVLEAYSSIRDAGLPGVIEVVPALRSVTVYYDPSVTSGAWLRGALERLLAISKAAARGGEDGAELSEAARRWVIPACYDPELAPDVQAVAQHCGLAAWQVTALHACVAYRVLMVGFLPGLPYLGELPPPLRLPRRDNPRTAVPPGSIAIAGTMSVIYPIESPGGWHIIGRTPARLFEPGRAVPAVLEPGDEVRFKAIGRDELEALTSAARTGRWSLEPERCAA